MQITDKVVRVLNVFLADTQQGRYGLELMREADLQSGTLYPILARLERAGWLTSAKEDIDPHTIGRPARRYYLLTPNGVVQAVRECDKFHKKVRAPRSISLGAIFPEGRTA